MKTNKTYYSISEVANMLNIKEHTIRFWDSKLPGLSKQAEKGKTRFFNENHINKISNLNQLLEKNDSLDLAYKLISKEKKNRTFNSFLENNATQSDFIQTNKKKHKIQIITKNLKGLISKN